MEVGDEESQLIPRAITNIPVFSESTPGFMMSMMMVNVDGWTRFCDCCGVVAQQLEINNNSVDFVRIINIIFMRYVDGRLDRMEKCRRRWVNAS